MTERVLWRRQRQQDRDGASPPGSEGGTRLVAAVVSGALALVAVVAGSLYGNVRPRGPGNHLEMEVVAWASAAVFSVAGSIATRRAAGVLGHFVTVRTIKAAGVAVRLLATVTGYVVVLFTALGLLSVSVSHILTAGALTGVVIGIAAQQSLGNVFAGMVLLLARPFTIGDHIRVRSGSLGGLFDGVVLGMSLTYVTLSTDDGLLKVPNSALLASAVGPYRPRPAQPDAPGPAALLAPARSDGSDGSAGTVGESGTARVRGESGTARVRGDAALAGAPAPEGAEGAEPADHGAPDVESDPWRRLAQREDVPPPPGQTQR